jgi:hypothetical protein
VDGRRRWRCAGISLAANKAVTALLVMVAILPTLQFGFWLLQASSSSH